METEPQTRECPDCGGTMYHSDDMESPFTPTDEDRSPFWQCEQCGKTIDA